MPFPNVNSEFETLLEPTRIWLFGKPFKSIRYVPEEMWGIEDEQTTADSKVNAAPLRPSPERVPGRSEASAGNGEPQPVRKPAPGSAEEADTFAANEFKNYLPQNGQQLPMPPRRIERKLRQADQSFVRIYSFSFEGHYYRLPRPLLFLLSGPGTRPDEDPSGGGYADRHVSFATKFGGIASRDWQFGDDIRVWAVDRKDLAVCLDVEVANYHELLLNSMVAGRGSASRGDMVSRGDVVGRGDGSTASRGAGAGAFRGDMIGPHQNW
jgi:hypothetical protein